MGASTQRCIRDLSKLYDRTLRQHAHTVGIATEDLSPCLFPYCERTVLLTNGAQVGDSADHPAEPKARRLDLRAPDIWERILEAVSTRN
jgi:hypothetical protein